MSKILKECQIFVENYFKNSNKNLYYHNINHIKEVVEHSSIIADYLKIPEEDKEILLIAAWFHDIYHVVSHINHEEESAEIAKNFLLSKNYPEEKINKVIGCILATRVPQLPENLIEKIICDADLFHAGTEEFFNRNNLYRKEIEFKLNKKFSDNIFIEQTIAFFKSHSFFTDYAQKFLNNQKKKNLKQLKSILSEKI